MVLGAVVGGVVVGGSMTVLMLMTKGCIKRSYEEHFSKKLDVATGATLKWSGPMVKAITKPQVQKIGDILEATAVALLPDETGIQFFFGTPNMVATENGAAYVFIPKKRLY
jgi:hypothetical protein